MFYKLIVLLLLIPYLMFSKPLEIDVFAKNVLLINADTGAVLYEKNANEPLFPASTTKIASALYIAETKKDMIDQVFSASSEALEKIDPKEKKSRGYIDPPYLLETDGTRLWMLKNEKFPIRSLLYGMLLPSGNDASNVAAEAVSGSIPVFMEQLNAYLQSIGCKNTHFRSPHGLHDPNHHSTATDMALIARRALQSPLLQEIMGCTSYVLPKTNFQKHRVIHQNNPLVKQGHKYYYPYAIGMKTGAHSAGKFCLLAAAKKGDRTLIAVIFRCEENSHRFIDARRLFDAAFAEEIVKKKLLDKKAIFSANMDGARRAIRASLKQDLYYEYYPSEASKIQAFVRWQTLNLPVEKGQKVGLVEIKNADGEMISSLPIFAKESVSKTFLHSVRDFFFGKRVR